MQTTPTGALLREAHQTRGEARGPQLEVHLVLGDVGRHPSVSVSFLLTTGLWCPVAAAPWKSWVLKAPGLHPAVELLGRVSGRGPEGLMEGIGFA